MDKLEQALENARVRAEKAGEEYHSLTPNEHHYDSVEEQLARRDAYINDLEDYLKCRNLISKTTNWQFDKYFSRVENCNRQEHVIFKNLKDGRVERTTITRNYFDGDDYQDSTETVIL